MLHCQMIQAGEIQAIVGDASRDGMGGPHYSGLWSLTSKHYPFNAFGNSFAGLLPSEIRGGGLHLEIVDENEVALTAKDVRAVYRIKPPYCIDHELTVTDRQDRRLKANRPCGPGEGEFRESSWCCYMNGPEDRRIHFISNGQWARHLPPKHGQAARIAPTSIPDDQLERFPKVKTNPPFYWSWADIRFDQPFYYGRVGPMVMLLIFDCPQWLRMFSSPDGGGPALQPGNWCPAWDFLWAIPSSQYKLNVPYRFRVRLVYKLFDSDDDVLDEVRRSVDELGFNWDR